jgi:hypothetical protein
MTHSTFVPFAWRRFDEINAATLFAIAIVAFSSDSRTPFRRPSIVGRIPTFGGDPINLFVGLGWLAFGIEVSP